MQNRLINISCIFISLELDWRFQKLENPISSIVVLIEKLEKASSLAQAQDEQPVFLAFAFFALVTHAFCLNFCKKEKPEESPSMAGPWTDWGRGGHHGSRGSDGGTASKPQSLTDDQKYSRGSSSHT